MKIAESELIINEDGSIYHLNLKPGELSSCIITVGDQNRVDKVASYFDKIELVVQKREFRTITGYLKGKRLSVISTGIGTDNIDIVLNEIDALFNIDLQTREIKTDKVSLDFIRIGTSGAIQSDIPVDSIMISNGAIGTDGLLNYYHYKESKELKRLDLDISNIYCYYVEADHLLVQHFQDNHILNGITVTANGFYGPQMRTLRLEPNQNAWLNKIESLSFGSLVVSNLEMETAGIFGLARLLGHRAISINALLANRKNGMFSNNPEVTETQMIEWALTKIVNL